MRIQKRREQVVIEESVKLGLEQQKVTVQLPFMMDPVEYLVEKQRSNSNYGQALRVNISQGCKKPWILERCKGR